MSDHSKPHGADNPHAPTQAALGAVRAGVIRNAIEENVQPNALGVIPPFSFQPPGGVSGWKRVRISNYSPYVFQVIGVPGGGSGDPPQLLQPFQQNVWNYLASRGTITLIAAQEGSPLAVPPLRFAYADGTAAGELLFNYVTVEWTDTPDLFFGYYPSPLPGIAIEAEALHVVSPVPTVIPVGTTPVAIAMDVFNNRAYVANNGSHNVSVIDLNSNTVVATIDVTNPPTDLAVNLADGKLYVARSGVNDVLIIQANVPIGSVNVGAAQTGITVDPFTGKKYVSLVTDRVRVIGPTELVIGAPIVVGTGPKGIDANPATGQVYVANETDGTVSQIDEATELVVGPPIAVGAGPVDVRADGLLNQIYSADAVDDTVSDIDGLTALVTATVLVGNKPVGLDIDQTRSRLYVANQDSNSVSVVDENTNVVIDTLSPGVGPTDVGLNPVANTVYVPIAANAVVVLAGTP